MKLTLITTLAVAVLGLSSVVSFGSLESSVRVLDTREILATRGAQEIAEPFPATRYCKVTFKQRMCTAENNLSNCSGNPGSECKTCRVATEGVLDKSGTCVQQADSSCALLDKPSEECGTKHTGTCQFNEDGLNEWYCTATTDTKDKCPNKIEDLCF